jgi:hypothetical protein
MGWALEWAENFREFKQSVKEREEIEKEMLAAGGALSEDRVRKLEARQAHMKPEPTEAHLSEFDQARLADLQRTIPLPFNCHYKRHGRCPLSKNGCDQCNWSGFVVVDRETGVLKHHEGGVYTDDSLAELKASKPDFYEQFKDNRRLDLRTADEVDATVAKVSRPGVLVSRAEVIGRAWTSLVKYVEEQVELARAAAVAKAKAAAAKAARQAKAAAAEAEAMDVDDIDEDEDEDEDDDDEDYE